MDELKRTGCIRRAAWFGFLAMAAGLGAEASAATYTGLVVFGDSLSDTGNTYAAAGFPPVPYYDGRYSNGPMWVDYLAAKLGVAAPPASFLGGTNYAWGYAQSGDGFSHPLGPDGPGVPNLLTQVGGFLQAGGRLDAGQVVTIWAGANDFLNNGATDYVRVADNVVAAISALAGAGGSTFLVGGLPFLGTIPGDGSLTPDQRAGLNLLSMAFNGVLGAKIQAVQASLPGVHIIYNDVSGGLQQIFANAAAYGFTNTADAALASGVLDGKGYFFWDSVHPTTAVHALIADAAYAELVPEPSSLGLAAIAGATVLAAARANRSRRDA